MSTEAFENDLRFVVREPVPTDVPGSLRSRVADIPWTKQGGRSHRLQWARGMAPAIGGAVVVLAVLLAGAFALGIHSGTDTLTGSDPGSSLAITTDPTAGAQHGCPLVGINPVRMELSGGSIIFVSTLDGRQIEIDWPNGFQGKLLNGQAQLLDPSGRIVAREGDVLDNLGGPSTADGVIHICQIGSTNY